MSNILKVTFQGERGAYSELAALQYFNTSNILLLPRRTLADVFYSVEINDTHYAVVPIENSIEGSVNETYDLLMHTNLNICGEIYLRIVHCLIGYDDSSIEDIKYVYSHPQALGQCREFIKQHGFEPIPYYDTAGSVKMLKEKRIERSAAIASKLAAEVYGMKVILEGIEDSKNNYTRFIVLTRNYSGKATGNDKTSIIFIARHVAGSLYSVLEEFAVRGINLTMIVSRPLKDRPWEYSFYLDFEGHILDKNVRECLDMIKDKVVFLKVLGSYPKASMNT